MGKPEGTIENHLIKQVKKFGYMQRKVTALSSTGFPDRLVIGNGLTVFVELKTPQGHPSERQKLTIREMRKNGATVYIIDTKEDCERLLQAIHDNKLDEFEPTCRHNHFDEITSNKS